MPPTLAPLAEDCPDVVPTDRAAKTNMHRRYAGHSNIRSSKLLIPSSESLIGRCVVESVSIVPDVVDLALSEAERRPDTHLELVRLALQSRRSLLVVDFTLLELGHVIGVVADGRSEEHTSELQSRENIVCRLL